MLFMVDSTMAMAKAAATAASAALPPISNMRTPASVARGWPVATIPFREEAAWAGVLGEERIGKEQGRQHQGGEGIT